MQLPRTPSFSLENRRALVTGGSSGIGLACATALAEAGAAVVVAARNSDKVNDVVETMRAAGWQAEAAALDVADVEATEAFISEAGPF